MLSRSKWSVIFAVGSATVAVGVLRGQSTLELAGILLALIGLMGLLIWGWILRSSGGKRLILISRFSELSTTEGVSQARLHQRKLARTLVESPGLSEFEFRPICQIGERAARILLGCSQVEAVVFGEAEVADDRVNWEVQLLYRVWAYAMGGGLDYDGQPYEWTSDAVLADAQRRVSWKDGSQEIRLLASSDFPASHAVGIAATLSCLGGDAVRSVESFDPVRRSIAGQWNKLPTKTKALAKVMESSIAAASLGRAAAYKVLKDAIHKEQIVDPLLQSHFASICMMRFAHGQLKAKYLVDAIHGLEAIDAENPYLPYMLGCARMVEQKWDEAVPYFRKAANEEKYQKELGPRRAEVANAWAQAAKLADDPEEYDDACRVYYKESLPLTRRIIDLFGGDLKNTVGTAIWAFGHAYDGRNLGSMQARLDELGADLNIKELRENVWSYWATPDVIEDDEEPRVVSG